MVDSTSLPEGPARDRREVELQLGRGLYPCSQLTEGRGERRQLFLAVYGLWQSANGAGRIRDCRRLSNRLQELAAASTDNRLQLQAQHSAFVLAAGPALHSARDRMEHDDLRVLPPYQPTLRSVVD
jgi:hypothetical protein